MALKMNGEVPFPLAGEGAFLRFNLQDIAELESIYGVGEYLQVIDANIQEGSGGTVLKCLSIGAKRRNSDNKIVRLGLGPDDIDFAIVEAHEPIMDALFLQVTNMTYQEAMAEVARRQAEMERLAAAGESPAHEPKENPDDPLPVSGESNGGKQ